MNYRRLLPQLTLEDIFFPIDEKLMNSNAVSFKAIDNESLILPILAQLQNRFPNQEIQESVQAVNNRQFQVKLRLLEQEKTVMEKDKVYPQLIIDNSYDGSVRPKVRAGYVRVVCTNGMLAFDEIMEVEIEEETAVETEHLAPVFEFLTETGGPLATFKQLAKRVISRSEMDFAAREMIHQPTIQYPQRLIRRARLVTESEAHTLGTPMSAWLLYNGFNHALNHIPFAFGNQDLRRLDKQILGVVQKVIRADYQPIVLPNRPKVLRETKKVKQERISCEMAGA